MTAETGPLRFHVDAPLALRRAFGPIARYEVGWKLVSLFLLGPLTFALLNVLISLSHERAITNKDLIGFGLSPTGIVSVALFSLLTVAIAFVEHAGLCLLLWPALHGRVVNARAAVLQSSLRIPSLLGLASVQITLGSIAALPILAFGWLTYGLLLSGSDINYYLANKPPRFLVALGIGVLLVIIAAVLGSILFVRWIFAVPCCLFEGKSPHAALRASSSLVRGRSLRFFASLLVNLALQWAVVVGVFLLLDFLNGAILAAIDDTRPLVVIAVIVGLMVFDALVVSAAFMFQGVAFGFLVLTLYDRAHRARGGTPPGPDESNLTTLPSNKVGLRGKRLLALIGIVATVAFAYSFMIVRRFSIRRPLSVTAHRAGSSHAPENSLSALRMAISEGADYAEIDVQRTADGVVVVAHDEDLKRVAGVARRIRDMRLADLKTVDIGSSFSSKFKGEHVPTLVEFIEAARGKIKLNVELKYYEHDPRLARQVVEILHDQDFVSEAIVSSLSDLALVEVRQLDPRIKLGAIVSASLGDITRLDIDFLSLRRGLVTARRVREVHSRGLEVHAWGIKTPSAMFEAISRGVDNMITDDPVIGLEAVRHYRELTDAQVILLRFRDWFGAFTFQRLFSHPVRFEPATGGELHDSEV